jgi:hypothetical protein
MAQKSRELSQFSSFLEVDNSNKNIGIATTTTPYVGIGTTNPTYKFDVSGQARIAGDLHISGNSVIDAVGQNLILQGNTGYGIVFRTNGANDRGRIDGGGAFLVGTSSSTGTASQLLQVTGGTYISGNTGIGTTSPSSKLTVIGDTNISGIVSATGYYLNGSQLVSAALQTWDINGSNIYRSTGNVGIGSSIPGSKLTVAGDITATGAITGSNISVSGITISSGIITASQFVSTVASGTAPLVVTSSTQVTNLNASFLRGKTPPSGDIVGDTDTQTLTNKTLTSPLITSPTVSSAGIAFSGSTSGTTTLRSSAVATGIATLPTITTSDTLVARNTTDTLTNKTIAAGSNTISGLTNSNLSGSAGITNANLANSTISGISLGSNLNNLTAGTFINYSSGTTYNGSTTITVSVAATTANTANTIVARNASGDFTAGTINCSYLNASFDINSNSDEILKKNIVTIQNSLETVSKLRGVKFEWKETEKPSIGVIAQELEKVLPELVNNNGEHKAVNYNGMIGVLIEAIKELSQEVQELKAQLNN